MSQNRMDLTAIDAETQKNSLKVVRKPVPFLYREEDGMACLYKIEDGKAQKRATKLPMGVFKLNFIQWPNSKKENDIYCKKPGIAYASQIDTGFYIVSCGFDDEILKLTGDSGDFVITRESSGVNEICKKEDFSTNFILEHEFYSGNENSSQELSNI